MIMVPDVAVDLTVGVGGLAELVFAPGCLDMAKAGAADLVGPAVVFLDLVVVTG